MVWEDNQCQAYFRYITFRKLTYSHSEDPIIIEEDSPYLAKPAVIHGEYEIQQADFVEALIKNFPTNLPGKNTDEAAQKARDEIHCCHEEMPQFVYRPYC